MKTESLTNEELYALLDEGNDSGMATADLVEIVQTHQANEWSDPMTFEEFIAWEDSLLPP